MSNLLPNIDPDGLLEYSVVYTDRSLNHMSQLFQGVMNEISSTLKKVYCKSSKDLGHNSLKVKRDFHTL